MPSASFSKDEYAGVARLYFKPSPAAEDLRLAAGVDRRRREDDASGGGPNSLDERVVVARAVEALRRELDVVGDDLRAGAVEVADHAGRGACRRNGHV